jgi:hypothetical protein
MKYTALGFTCPWIVCGFGSIAAADSAICPVLLIVKDLHSGSRSIVNGSDSRRGQLPPHQSRQTHTTNLQ